MVSPDSDELLGRATELQVLLDVLHGGGPGGRALVLRGRAGAGKSALLAEAARSAASHGMRVLCATGVHCEDEVPFAALHSMLSPLLGAADSLPAPQRQALLRAFGTIDGAAPPQLLLGLAALHLLAGAAAQRPVLVVADDLHWFDGASLQTLLFVARRLDVAPVRVLAGVRDGRRRPLEDADLDELVVRGLAPSDAERLLDVRAPGLEPRARQCVLAWAQGNPLALRELPSTVELAGCFPEREWIPLTSRLARAFGGRLPELPVPTRTLLLAAAMHPAHSLGEVCSVAADVDPAVTLEDLSPAVRAGLVDVEGDTVCVSDPLVRSAVYQAAVAHDRIAMHAAVAARCSRFPEQQLWHRVAACVGPDPDLARQLQQLAARYVRRGELRSAVTALERSADLTQEESVRGERLLDAASGALHLGRTARVDELLRQTEEVLLRPRDVRRRRLLCWARRPPVPGDRARLHDVVLAARASAADGDRDTAVALLLVAARAGAFGGHLDASGGELLEALTEIGGRDEDPRCLLIRAIADPLRSSAAVVRAARSRRSPELDVDATAMTAAAAMWVHAADVAKPLLDEAEDGLRRRGDLVQLSQVLMMRGWARFFLGDWNAALSDAAAGASSSRATEQPTSAALLDVLSATAGGLQGRRNGFEASISAAEQLALGVGAAAVSSFAALGRGLVCMADGEYAASYQHLARLHDPHDAAHHPVFGAAWLTYLAEAAVHCGRTDDARAVLHDVEPVLRLSDAAQLHISVRHARAVLAGDDEAEVLFKEGLTADLSGWPLDRGRLQLAWGMWLRRRRRSAESRDPLRRARDAFEAVGAPAWASQARRELRAAGERSAGAEHAQHRDLTPQELQIAQLAALGLSNREIGEQVFASPRTVSSHLYRIFPKLGITSRRQLGTVLAQHGAEGTARPSALTSG